MYHTSDIAVGVGVGVLSASSEDITMGSPWIANAWVATMALEPGAGLFLPLLQKTRYVC